MTVTREAEWDDDSREEMLALAEYEAGVCACGFHKSIAQNKSHLFSFEQEHCHACAGWAQYGRLQAQDDHEEDERLKGAAPEDERPSDGRRVHMRVTPAGTSLPEQAPGE